MKPLRIALTKGRLERDTVAMFERIIGFDCTAVHEKGRKLILPIGDNQFEDGACKSSRCDYVCRAWRVRFGCGRQRYHH